GAVNPGPAGRAGPAPRYATTEPVAGRGDRLGTRPHDDRARPSAATAELRARLGELVSRLARHGRRGCGAGAAGRLRAHHRTGACGREAGRAQLPVARVPDRQGDLAYVAGAPRRDRPAARGPAGGAGGAATGCLSGGWSSSPPTTRLRTWPTSCRTSSPGPPRSTPSSWT